MPKGGEYAKSSLYPLFKKIFGGNIAGVHSPVKTYNLAAGSLTSISRNKQFMKLLNEKKGLLIATFVNLIVQIGITYYALINYKTFIPTNNTDKQPKDPKKPISWGLSFGLFLAQLGLIFIIAAIPMNMIFKFILFSIFSVLSGILLVNTQSRYGSGVLQFALLGSIAIFVVMAILGAGLMYLGIQLGIKFALILFYLLLTLIIVTLISMFMKTYSAMIKVLSGFGLILFSAYIVYDTNKILQRDYYGDFITSSMDYYLDVLNVFVDIIGIAGNN
jgi:FtsH-binding integral membrane protein